MKSACWLVALPLLLLPSLAAAEVPADTLRGVVTDADGRPLAGAEVLVPSLDRVVQTGDAGEFVLPDVPAGRYRLVVRLSGYAPEVREADVRGSGELAVRLREAPFRIAGVTVTATRAAEPGAASPLAVSSLEPADVRREHGVSLAHVLDDQPGVRTLSTGEQVGKPVIRGLSGPRVLVLENGLRLEDYSWSQEDAPPVDARLADRVEVIRGPASLLYGSDALGGAVNVLPEAIPDAMGGPGFSRAGAETYVATNNREGGLVLRGEGASGSIGWRATGVGRFAEDYRSADGPVENTGFLAANGEAAVGTRGPWGSATLRYQRYGGEFKLLEAEGPGTGGAGSGPIGEEGPERKLSDDRVQLSANLPLGGTRVETRAQWQRHWLAEVADEPGGGGVPGQETTQFDLLLNTLGVDVVAHDVAGSEGTTVGVSGTYQANDTRGPVPLVPDARLAAAAIYALQAVELGPVRLLGGVRGDWRSVHARANQGLGLAAQDSDLGAVVGSAGLVYRPVEPLSITVNAGRAWRAPTLFELYSNGPRLGEARYDVGRADLDPELGLELDAGLHWQSGVFGADVTAFRNRISNFVFASPTPETRDGLRVYRYGQANALLWGGEASARVEPLPVLSLSAGVDAVRATNLDTDESLPFTPAPRALLAGELHAGDLAGWAQRAYFNAQAELVARQAHAAPEEVAPPAYGLLNLGAGFVTRAGGRDLSIDLQLRNATNTAYRSFLSRYKEFALDPGRNLTVRVGVGI